MLIRRWGLADRAMDRLLRLPPPTIRRYEVERDLRIPMPDGVVLLADRYRPTGTAPQPVVLVRTPYGRRGLNGRVFGAAMARRGFQVVLQSVRGTFGSGGRFRGLAQETDDGLATAAWLRAQPWCDGRLAMVGGSYLGAAQWALAPHLDPPLAAMCPAVTASTEPGGAFPLRDRLSWAVRLDRQEHLRFGGLLPDRRHNERMTRAFSQVPLRNADIVAVGHELPLWRALLTDTSESAPPDLSGLRTPVSMVTGWHDHHLPGQLADFRALADTTARITIGPWGHGDLATMSATVTDQLSWLAEHLHGATPEPRGPVRAFLQHADEWLDLPAWPPDSVPTPLYLAAGGTLTWQPPPAGASDWFVYDPADPTPDSPPRHDNRAIEARADVLVYGGEPLPRDLDVLGDVHAILPVRVEPGPADVVARLCDVDPDGVSRTVCDGLLRLRPDSPAPDGIVRAVVPMWPTGYRFRAGHRLRVHVTGGAFPRYTRNFGTGEPIADAVRMLPCHCEVPHDPRFPPRLVLPVRSS